MDLPTSDVQGRVGQPAALPRAPWDRVHLASYCCWPASSSAGRRTTPLDGDFALHGPWLAPLVVTAGWVVLATWLPGRPVRSGPASRPRPPGRRHGYLTEADEIDGGDPDMPADAEQPASVQWLTPALLSLALLGYVLALDPVGFVLASAVFFVVAARILGSHHSIRTCWWRCR